MAESRQRNPRLRRYPPELRERAVRLVYETMAETGERHGAMRRVASQLGIGYTSVRHWLREADIAEGRVAPAPSALDERIRELERENRELRRANEILKSASAFFAAELDRHSDS
jgi:transposase